MTDFEEYKEHIRYTHHAYCKIVIRHAAIDAVRRLLSRWKREISFEYMAEALQKHFPSCRNRHRKKFFCTTSNAKPKRKSVSGTDRHAAPPGGISGLP